MAKRTWFAMKASGEKSADIRIHSEIGGYGVTAQMFSEDLRALGKREDLHISINSDGGDVTAGFAIYNMLSRHPANKVVTIEGIAASMGSVIAMAGDDVVMPSNAMMMIHNPWGVIMGEADQIESFANALTIMQDNIARTYSKRTKNVSLAEIRKMMDKETWFSAKEAVAKGFADRIEGKVAAAAMSVGAYNLARFSNVPTILAGLKRKEPVMAKTNEEMDFEGKTEAEIRTEVAAVAKEIRSVCKLAGFADLADDFIGEGKTVSEVVAALDTKKAEAAEAAKGDKDKGGDTTARRPNADSKATAGVDTTAIYKKFNSAGRNRAA